MPVSGGNREGVDCRKKKGGDVFKQALHLLGHLLQVGPGVALDAEEKGRFETMAGEQTCFQKVISMPEAFIEPARESVTSPGKTKINQTSS